VSILVGRQVAFAPSFPQQLTADEGSFVLRRLREECDGEEGCICLKLSHHEAANVEKLCFDCWRCADRIHRFLLRTLDRSRTRRFLFCFCLRSQNGGYIQETTRNVLLSRLPDRCALCHREILDEPGVLDHDFFEELKTYHASCGEKLDAMKERDRVLRQQGEQ
jgi:hypothetical protein